MPSFTKAAAGAAMKIVRLDRNKFNQAVADGHYPCAPSTIPGARRFFEMADLIGLYVFARMTERGQPARYAGRIACQIMTELRRNPEASKVHRIQALNGAIFVDSDNYPGEDIFAGTKIEAVETYNIKNIRSIIQQALDEYSSVAGAEEE